MELDTSAPVELFKAQLDAVIADFMAGSIEYLSPDNDADHWDLIEGQGSLFHASYSGVTLALIHGGQPDALVVCHEPTREHMRGLPGRGVDLGAGGGGASAGRRTLRGPGRRSLPPRLDPDPLTTVP